MDVSQVLMTPSEVSEMINISRETLANWRSEEIGPDYVRIGGKVMYLLADINEYIDRNHVRVGGVLK